MADEFVRDESEHTTCPLCGEPLGSEKMFHAICAAKEQMYADAAADGVNLSLLRRPVLTPEIEAKGRALEPTARRVLATDAVIAAARELVAHAEGDTEPTVDGYDLDRLRKALAALDAAKGGQ